MKTPQIADKMKLKKIINIVCIAIMIGSMMGMVYAVSDIAVSKLPYLINATEGINGSVIWTSPTQYILNATIQLTYRQIIPDILECYELSGKEIGNCFKEIRSRFDFKTRRYTERSYKFNMTLFSGESVNVTYYWSIDGVWWNSSFEQVRTFGNSTSYVYNASVESETWEVKINDTLDAYEKGIEDNSELGEEEFIPKENCSVDIAKKYNLTDKEWRELLYMMGETSQNRIIDKEYIKDFGNKSLESFIEILEECHNIK